MDGEEPPSHFWDTYYRVSKFKSIQRRSGSNTTCSSDLAQAIYLVMLPGYPASRGHLSFTLPAAWWACRTLVRMKSKQRVNSLFGQASGGSGRKERQQS